MLARPWYGLVLDITEYQYFDSLCSGWYSLLKIWMVISCPSILIFPISTGWSVLFRRISCGLNWRFEAFPADCFASLSTPFVLGLFLPGTRTSLTGVPCLLERTASRTSSFHCLALSTGLPCLVVQPFFDQTDIAVPKFSATYVASVLTTIFPYLDKSNGGWRPVAIFKPCITASSSI